jgi:chemotaxis protein CheD
MRLKHLKTGEAGIGFEKDTLTTGGVGSCVVMCLWDPNLKLGAMAHMFQANKEMLDPNELRSAGASPDTAVPYLLNRMLGMGAKLKDVQVRLIGAGNMFGGIEDGFVANIGKNILDSVTNEVIKSGLAVKSQSVGGRLGRSVSFSVSSGVIEIGLTNGEQVIL